ncbi:MAG: sigma-70 family RNA polymerase sigma factor [Deltaproteobacteria bacterium]|jgi:RNA polymerase sigma-70 factor (ECF subfamily)
MSDSKPSRRAEIAELYVTYGPMVFTRCRYLLRDEEAARDATQEVFVKVMRSLDGFRQDSALSTWIVRIATNHCLNVIASNKAKWRERFQRYMEHMDEGGLLAGVDPERARLVQQVLGKVDKETQAVAVHYYVDEMTQQEIADLMGRSLPTVRKRLAKFTRVAKKELAHGQR